MYVKLLEIDEDQDKINNPFVRVKIASYLELPPYKIEKFNGDSAVGLFSPTFSHDSKLITGTKRFPPLGRKGSALYIFDFKTKKFLYSFSLDTIQILYGFAWTKDTLFIVGREKKDSIRNFYRVVKEGDIFHVKRVPCEQRIQKGFFDIYKDNFIIFEGVKEGEWHRDLYMLNMSNGEVTRLTNDIFLEATPKIEGDKLIFFSNTGGFSFDIFMADITPKGLRNVHPLTKTYSDEYFPSIDSQKEKIIFSTEYQVFLKSLKSKEDFPLRLTFEKMCSFRMGDLSSNGRYVILEGLCKKPQFYIIDLGSPIPLSLLKRKLLKGGKK